MMEFSSSSSKALTTSCCSFSTFPWVHKEKTTHNNEHFFLFQHCSHLSSPVVKISCKNLAICTVMHITSKLLVLVNQSLKTTFFPEDGPAINWNILAVKQHQRFFFSVKKNLNVLSSHLLGCLSSPAYLLHSSQWCRQTPPLVTLFSSVSLANNCSHSEDR